GLARGYLNRPALTAAKFIPDPFSTRLGERMYRTGDLAKWLPTGELVGLGRRDLRIKLREYRIELEEIDSILMQHPSITECAVAVRGVAESQDCLVCFAVTRDRPGPRPNELRRFLKQKLPLFM